MLISSSGEQRVIVRPDLTLHVVLQCPTIAQTGKGGEVVKLEREQAEAVALEALTYLAQDPDRLGRFLVQTGTGPEQVRERYSDPDFLSGVLDYLLSDESLLITFVEERGLEPALPAAARRELPGADAEI